MLTFSEDLLEISEEDIEKYREKVKNFIIPDPNDELIEIYEIDKLVNLIGIRAEKYYSPEYHTELEELRKKWMICSHACFSMS